MTAPTLRIDAAGIEPIVFAPEFGWAVYLDLGSVEIREVTTEAPGVDGVIDSTRYIGARDVIIAGTMLDDVEPLWRLRERLAAFLAPTVRPTITFSEAPDAPTKIVRNLRGVRIPQRVVHRPADAFSATFRAGWGVIESATEHTAIARASASESTVVGRSYPKVYPWSYAAAPISGSTEVVNAGNATAYPVLRLRGPMSDRIEVRHLETDRAIVIDGLTVPAGQYLEIDTRSHRVDLNGDREQSRRQFVVFPDSAWWTLAPGPQRIRLVCETFDSPAQAEIIWRDAWL